MSYIIKIINTSQLSMIKSLWEKLNKIHLNESDFFKDFYENFSFEKRCKKFDNIEDKHIRIEIVEDNKIPIGYCISTINNNVGEIDSLFIEEEYRKFGYGKILIENSVNWLKKNNCTKIILGVAQGHESVFDYYKKFDFYPRVTYLQLKE